MRRTVTHFRELFRHQSYFLSKLIIKNNDCYALISIFDVYRKKSDKMTEKSSIIKNHKKSDRNLTLASCSKLMNCFGTNIYINGKPNQEPRRLALYGIH